MITRKYSYNYLIPAARPELATVVNARLPWGGQTGTGATFGAGLVLGCVAGTVQSEVATLTVGTSTGTISNYYRAASGVYAVSHAYDASLATVRTAWEAVFGSGNVAVTGVAGTNYILTFQNVAANTRIGGFFDITSNGNAAWARTTRGSSGAGQYDVYDNTGGSTSLPTTAQRILQFDYYADPLGGNWNPDTGATFQPYSPPMYSTGIFNYADLTGFDSNALADPGFRIYRGAAVTDTGAQIALGL